MCVTLVHSQHSDSRPSNLIWFPWVEPLCHGAIAAHNHATGNAGSVVGESWDCLYNVTEQRRLCTILYYPYTYGHADAHPRFPEEIAYFRSPALPTRDQANIDSVLGNEITYIQSYCSILRFCIESYSVDLISLPVSCHERKARRGKQGGLKEEERRRSSLSHRLLPLPHSDHLVVLLS